MPCCAVPPCGQHAVDGLYIILGLFLVTFTLVLPILYLLSPCNLVCDHYLTNFYYLQYATGITLCWMGLGAVPTLHVYRFLFLSYPFFLSPLLDSH